MTPSLAPPHPTPPIADWQRRRRRGQVGAVLSLYIMMVAKDMFWLSAGNFLFSALNNFPTTVYAAVIPELIHPEQVSATTFQTVLGGRRFHSDASLCCSAARPRPSQT